MSAARTAPDAADSSVISEGRRRENLLGEREVKEPVEEEAGAAPADVLSA